MEYGLVSGPGADRSVSSRAVEAVGSGRSPFRDSAHVPIPPCGTQAAVNVIQNDHARGGREALRSENLDVLSPGAAPAKVERLNESQTFRVDDAEVVSEKVSRIAHARASAGWKGASDVTVANEIPSWKEHDAVYHSLLNDYPQSQSRSHFPNPSLNPSLNRHPRTKGQSLCLMRTTLP